MEGGSFNSNRLEGASSSTASGHIQLCTQKVAQVSKKSCMASAKLGWSPHQNILPEGLSQTK